MPDLSEKELDALVEEATVDAYGDDAYGDDEQLGGFAVMIKENLHCPNRPRKAPSGSPRTGTGPGTRERVPVLRVPGAGPTADR